MAVLRYFHQPPKATTSTVVVNNTAILTVSAALNNKVDKSAGRGLSQNNYSTPEKNKLKGVEEGAEVNVLADWNELNIESDTYIQNKPESLPASDVYEWAKQPTKPVYTPTEIGLGNVTNDAQVKRSEMGVANGVATLNQDGLIPATQLPSYVDDVLEYSSVSLFPRPGTDGKIYVDTTTNLTYRWSGSDYVEISKSLALGETSSTAYRGDRGKTAYTHATDSSRLTTATAVGLYKVGCTAQGHISGLTAITKADITGLGIPAQDTNTTYSFAGGTNKFTVTPSGGTAQDVTVTPSISAATQSAAGLMSAADKKKLDGIAAGAQVNSVTGVKGNSESSYRTGNVNITATNIGLSNVANLDLSKAIKSITRSGTTFTYTCLDGTTGTFTLLDNNTTYSAGSGLSLSGTTFSLALTKAMVTTALGYTPPTSDTNTWRPITNTYTGSDLSTSVSQYGTNALYNALVNGYANSAGNADTVDNLHASNFVRFFLSPMTGGAPADSAKSWFTETMPSASGAVVYNVPGSEKTIIAGKSSGKHGHMLQLNYADNYLRLLRYYGGNWKTTDWEKISAGYADSAGSVAWSNVSSKPETATRWPSWSEVTGKPSTFAPSSHTHNYLPLSGGTMTGSITMSQGASARNVGIVGTYDSTKSAAIWAMGASYQIPAAGNSLGSLYGAAYVYQGLAGQGTMAGGHQFVWAQNGSANAALGTNIWTSGKFIKNGGTSSLFLKADGSVDSNAYITGITKAMVTTALGYTPPTTDTNTTYSAGTGLSLSSTTFSVKYGTAAGTACQGNDSRLSNSRPASDVYSWAKASTKPSYAWSEITSKPCSFYSGTCSQTSQGNNTIFYVPMSLADAQKVYSIQFVSDTTPLYNYSITYNNTDSHYPINSWFVLSVASTQTKHCTYRYIKE